MLFGYYIYDEGAKKLNKFINKLSLILLFVAGFAIVAMTLIMSLDVVASFLISSATTANPLPAEPAWAASIAALSASKLVLSATPAIKLVTSVISLLDSFKV